MTAGKLIADMFLVSSVVTSLKFGNLRSPGDNVKYEVWVACVLATLFVTFLCKIYSVSYSNGQIGRMGGLSTSYTVCALQAELSSGIYQ